MGQRAGKIDLATAYLPNLDRQRNASSHYGVGDGPRTSRLALPPSPGGALGDHRLSIACAAAPALLYVLV